MLIFRNILITLLLLALFAVAVIGVMIELPQIMGWTPDRVNALGRSFINVMRPRNGLLFFWLVLALTTFLILLISIARPRKRMKIEVQMGGGRVIIMDTAIKKYIRNALSELADVHVRKIDLREVRSGIEANVTADVRTRENLPVLERRIIQRVRTALTEEMGITNLQDVHVYIRDFEVTGRPVKGHVDKAEAKRASKESTAAGAVATGGAAASANLDESNKPGDLPKGDATWHPDPTTASDDLVVVKDPEPAWTEASTASAASDQWTADAPESMSDDSAAAPMPGPSTLDQRPGAFSDTSINFGSPLATESDAAHPAADMDNPDEDKPLDTNRG